ncbi:MAG: hypothetical protein KDD41_11670 [Flavobacteriales bacterium]|nr:hypothetical protein [Flavobacteriales bacterium]
MRILSLLSILFLLACQEPQSTEDTPPVAGQPEVLPEMDTIVEAANPHQEFLDFYLVFTKAFANWNADDHPLNDFFHPVHGVYVIYSTGAMPQIQRFMSPKEWEQNDVVFGILNTTCAELNLQPVFEELPDVVCDEDTYNKSGCFSQEINLLAESGIWNYSDLNEKEKQAVEYAAESVSVTLINTSCFTLYFSKTESGFKLSFVDIRPPCTA